jgi:hypothetical protein
MLFALRSWLIGNREAMRSDYGIRLIVRIAPIASATIPCGRKQFDDAVLYKEIVRDD